VLNLESAADDREIQAHLTRKLPRKRVGHVVLQDAQHAHAIAIPRLQRGKHRQFTAARSAPGRPHVDDDDGTFPVGE
jgi:hypothetical protein